jgi:hypothetical protein
MKEKKKTLVMYGDHKWNWQGTSSCIGWELPEREKKNYTANYVLIRTT